MICASLHTTPGHGWDEWKLQDYGLLRCGEHTSKTKGVVCWRADRKYSTLHLPAEPSLTGASNAPRGQTTCHIPVKNKRGQTSVCSSSQLLYKKSLSCMRNSSWKGQYHIIRNIINALRALESQAVWCHRLCNKMSKVREICRYKKVINIESEIYSGLK